MIRSNNPIIQEIILSDVTVITIDFKNMYRDKNINKNKLCVFYFSFFKVQKYIVNHYPRFFKNQDYIISSGSSNMIGLQHNKLQI